MRIKKVFVRNFRKFLQPVTVTGFHDGVCVIAGDNEEGKSTVVHAIRSAFHLKHNTQSTQHIQPYNSSAMPEVAVDFELNGTTYHLRKVFGKKGSAELRSDSGVFAGSEAEEKLVELCNASIGPKDSSIWNALWVEQGKTLTDLELGDAGKRTLQAALETELGSIVGGGRGQPLLKSVNELYLKWFTGTGRDSKNAEHKQAEELLTEIEKQLLDSSGALDQLQSSLESLDSTRAALKAHEDGRTIEVLQAAVIELSAKKAEIAKHLQAFEQAQQIVRTEQAQLAAAANAWKQRSQLSQEVETVNARSLSLEKQVQEVEMSHETACESLKTLAEQKALSETAYEKAVEACEGSEQIEQFRLVQTQVRETQDRIERAVSAQKHCDEIKSKGEKIKVDRQGIERARQAEKALFQFDTQLQTVATRLELLPANGADTVLLNGKASADLELNLTERAELDLGTWGRIVVSPGGGDLTRLKSNAANARKAFETALAALQVKTVEEAEALEAHQAELRIEWKSWHTEIQKFAPLGIAALKDELAVLQTRFEEASAALAAQLIDVSQASNPELLKQLRTAREQAKRELAIVRLNADKAETTYRDLDRQMQTFVAQLASAKDEARRCSEKLTNERSSTADAALFQALQEAEFKLNSATQKSAEFESVLKALHATAIEVEIVAAERKVTETRAELQRLRETQSRLEGSLQTLGKTGIAEEVEKLRGKQEQAQIQVQRAQRKARAIKLLQDTLVEAEKNSKQQLAAPLMKRLTPYMQDLFGGSSFAFDDANFGVVQLERTQAEPFGSLSLGTREQISVLTRLAFAETLAESGAPAVVILDDALVYSDEARFLKMQELLKRASERFQVIIMTCRERDYHSMGVPIIRLAECVGQEYVNSITLMPSVTAASTK